MINSDDVTKKDIKEHNPNWPLLCDDPYRILIITALDKKKQIHFLI